MSHITLSEQLSIWETQKNKTNIGIKISSRDVRNQLAIIFLELRKYASLNVALLTPADKFLGEKDWYSTELAGCTITTYSKTEEPLLKEFDIILLQETNPNTHKEFPESVIKIGMPHGIDVSLEQTLIYHGGGYCFDYILSQCKKDETPENTFQDHFIPEIRNKKESYICEIPFGFPKLDIFLKAVSENIGSSRKAIVYHVSSLAVEHEWVKEIIEPTLLKLLMNFPDHRIVFRPMHIDRQNPVIEKCVAKGGKYKNFHFSTADNYIHDYASAVAMVCHRPYTRHLFGLATGRSTFLCHPKDKTVKPIDPLFISCDEDDLIEKIRSCTAAEMDISTERRIAHCVDSGIYNPGSSIDYLVKNIHYILNDIKNPLWKYFPLNTGTNHDLKTQLALHILSATPGDKTFVLLMERYPKNPIYPLLVADSYSRVSWSRRFYFQVALQAFHSLIELNKKDGDVEIEEQMRLWWIERGTNTLNYVIQKSSIDNYELTINIKDLVGYSSEINQKNQQIASSLPTLRIIDPETHKEINYTGPISLYYAGNLCTSLIKNKLINSEFIEFIVDPKNSRQGNLFHGHVISGPDVLHTLDIPIVICSHTKRSEIYYQLKKEFGSDRKVYVVCHNDTSIRLLGLLDRAAHVPHQQPGD